MTFASCFLYAKKIVFSRSLKSDSSSKSGSRTLLGAIICIAISLVPVAALLSVSSGMIEGITGRLIHLSTGDIQVVVKNDSDCVKSATSILEAGKFIEKTEGVESVWPEISGNALAVGKSFRTGAGVRAVRKDVFSENQFYSSMFRVVEGKADLSEKKSCVIGEKISQILGLHAGDSIRIVTVSQGAGGRGVPKVSSFKVAGIVSCGYQELDALWVFVSLEDGFGFLSSSGSSCSFSVETGITFSNEIYLLQEKIRRSVNGEGTFGQASVYRWDQVNASSFENFSSTKSLLLIVMILIVIVAGINISSAVVMIVMERRKEIAIMKSVGATSGGITLSFVLVGLFAGLAGVIVGLPLGILFAVNVNSFIAGVEKLMNFFAGLWFSVFGNGSFSHIYVLDPAFYLQDIPVVVPVKEVFSLALVTLVLSVAMSILPAIKAGKEKPVSVVAKV